METKDPRILLKKDTFIKWRPGGGEGGGHINGLMGLNKKF
jgi:hypothetical protein